MGEPSRTETPRDELRRRIAEALTSRVELVPEYATMLDYATGPGYACVEIHSDRADAESMRAHVDRPDEGRPAWIARRYVTKFVRHDERETARSPFDVIVDEIVKLFYRVGERHEDLDVTAFGDMREQIWRQRFIVAELAREAEPERIEGAWRG